MTPVRKHIPKTKKSSTKNAFTLLAHFVKVSASDVKHVFDDRRHIEKGQARRQEYKHRANPRHRHYEHQRWSLQVNGIARTDDKRQQYD